MVTEKRAKKMDHGLSSWVTTYSLHMVSLGISLSLQNMDSFGNLKDDDHNLCFSVFILQQKWDQPLLCPINEYTSHTCLFFFFFKLWESGHHEMNQILCPIYLSNQDPQHTPVLFSDPCPAFLHPLPKFPDVGRQSGRREERHLHFLRYCKQLSPLNCAFP